MTAMRNIVEQLEAACEILVAERDDALAENERLRASYDTQRAAANDEIERLQAVARSFQAGERATFDGLCKTLAERDAALAECERLRAELKTLNRFVSPGPNPQSCLRTGES